MTYARSSGPTPDSGSAASASAPLASSSRTMRSRPRASKSGGEVALASRRRARRAVLQHEREALRRIRRIERHVGAARLEDRRGSPTTRSSDRSRHDADQRARGRRPAPRSCEASALARGVELGVATALLRRTPAPRVGRPARPAPRSARAGSFSSREADRRVVPLVEHRPLARPRRAAAARRRRRPGRPRSPRSKVS